MISEAHDRESLTDLLYKNISTTRYRPGILHIQAKVHKTVINSCPSFRPITVAIKIP